jgi:RNA polymerase sigma factor (sigma-70 family)
MKNDTKISERTRRFEAAMLPHLDSAFNLARWLLRDEHHAQDVVQDAYLRAFRYFDTFQGEAPRPWLLGIVRNTCFSWMKDKRRAGEQVVFDEEIDSSADDDSVTQSDTNPETLLSQKLERARIDQAIEELPHAFREVIVMRELEDLSYEEIAQCVGIPLGTVMSRLSRARALLRKALSAP